MIDCVSRTGWKAVGNREKQRYNKREMKEKEKREENTYRQAC